jgi:hypothetical protein
MAQIRAATVADAESISVVHVRAWQIGYRGLMPDAVLDAIDPAARAARWRDTLTDLPPGNVVYVAADGDRIIGFVRAGRARRSTAPRARARCTRSTSTRRPGVPAPAGR